MELLSLGPFTASILPWEPRLGEKSLTVCVKATFSLVPGQAEALDLIKEGPWEDLYWDSNPNASLFAPSDDVPVKPRADILLVGSAFAPGRSPVESLIVRLRVDDFSKTLRVTGDRVWVQAQDGPRPSQPKPFLEMPLRYERAAMRGENKIGTQPPHGGIAAGQLLPNIDFAEAPNPYQTPGFGPLPPAWRAARSHLTEEAFRWAHRPRDARSPAPPGIDFGFFNAAPRDQQVDVLRPDATIRLEGLSPRAASLETRLPGLRPRVFCAEGSGAFTEVPMRCDTLWIHTNREIAVLAWRGLVAANAALAATGLVVAAEAPGRELRPGDLETLVRERRGASALPNAAPNLPQPGAMTFVPIPGTAPARGAVTLPFAPGAAQKSEVAEPPKAPPPKRPIAPIASMDGRSTAVPTGAPTKPALPFAGATSPAVAPPPSVITEAASLPDIPVELCAAIAAEIDAGQAGAAQILERHKLSPEAWAAAERRWSSAIDEERRRGKSAVQDAFDEAYVAQIERDRGPIQVEEIARLEIGIERSDLPATLGALRLPRGALMRIKRVWLRKRMADAALAAKLRRATAEARSAEIP